MVIELARFLVKQIAADGDEGSSVERLYSFIDDYENQLNTSNEGERAGFDQNERNYAITIALRHPSVHAGSFLGPSSVSEKKVKHRGLKLSEESDDDDDKEQPQGMNSGTISALSKELISEDPQASEIDLITLQERHGEKLRLFADEKAISRAICGSKYDLTSLMRRIILYIMRTRGQGASFPQMMSDLQITNSNLFLQMKNLIDRDLIYKYKKNSHNHLVATKYAHLNVFFTLQESNHDHPVQENNDAVTVKEEEHDSEEDVTLQHVPEEDFMGHMTVQNEGDSFTDRLENDLGEEVYEDVKGDQSMEQPSASELITRGGTSVYPELKSDEAIAALVNNKARLHERILRLLSESPKGIILRQGLSFRVGIPHGKSIKFPGVDRAVVELQNAGLLQCCIFTIDFNGTSQKRRCLKINQEGIAHFDRQRTSAHEKYIKTLRKKLQSEVQVYGESAIVAEVPFERQMMEEIARSGPNGITIEEINSIFGGNEQRRRDLDRILNTAKTQVALPQYSDVFLSSALGQEGRKRIGSFRAQQWLSYQVSGNASTQKLKLSDLRSPIEVMPEIRLEKSDVDVFANHRKAPRTRGPGKKKSVSVQSTPSKPKGRPRKDYSNKALAAAARYRVKRGLPDDHDDQNSLQVSPTTNRAKRGRPRKYQRIDSEPIIEQDLAQGNRTSMDNVDESRNAMQSEADDTGITDTANVQESEIEQHIPSRVEETLNDQKTLQEDVSAERTLDIATIRGSKPNTAARFNVSMQAKYELLLEFFEQVKCVFSKRFDREYSEFVANANISELKRKNWKMDKKVRNKLFNALVDNNKVDYNHLSIKVKQRDTKQTLFFLKGLPEQTVSAYVEMAKRVHLLENQKPSEANSRYKSQSVVLKEGDVEIPAPSTLGTYRYHFNASNLEDLLSNPKYRDRCFEHDHIRSSFTGRFDGLIPRAQVVHRETWKMLNFPSESGKKFVKDDNVIDLSFWAFEPALETYLRLASAPRNNLLLSASQNARLLEQPLSKLDKRLRDSLELSQDGDVAGSGCRRSLAPTLRILCDLQLAIPVLHNGNEYVPVEWNEDHLLYRFIPTFEKPLWSPAGHFDPHLDKLSFKSQIDIGLFWSKMYEFRKGKIAGIPDEPNDPNDPEEVLWVQNAKLLKSLSAWDTSYRLYLPQKAFFAQARHLGINESHIEDQFMVRRLSYASVTPIMFVQRHLRAVFGLSEPKKLESGRTKEGMREILSNYSRGERTRAMTLVTGPMTLNQVRRQENRIKKRAKELRDIRAHEFDNVLDNFFSHHEIVSESDRDQLIKGMAGAREAYANGSSFINMDEVKMMLQAIQRFIETGEVGTYQSLVLKKQIAQKKIKRKETRIDVSNIEERRKSRKSVFEWSPEADELLRDCCVILRVRDQYRQPIGKVRKNWKALSSIFPFCSMNSLHKRFEKLKSAVGEEAYLAQLEVEWRKLWYTFRQTDVLPDEDPKDAIAFDLQVHVNFLREKIDKFAVLETLRSGTNESLPLDVGNLQKLYDLDRPPHTHLVLDPTNVITRHYAGDGSSDLRSDRLVRAAFSILMLDTSIASSKQERILELPFEGKKKMQTAFALKRMQLSTSEEAYDFTTSQKIKQINNIEDIEFRKVRNHLVSAHLAKAKEREEGRQVIGDPDQWSTEWNSFMSDQNFETIPLWQITESAFEQAISFSLDEIGGSFEVYRASGNVETAAGIVLADKGDIDLQIDLSPVALLSSNRLFNAKKTTDAQLEVPVKVKANEDRTLGAMLANITEKQDRLLQNVSKEEKLLGWAQDSSEPAKKAIRWEKACNSWLKENEFADENMSEATALLESVKSAGWEGITRSNLKTICEEEEFSLELMTELVAELLNFSPVLAFEAGCDEPRLVASIYVDNWTMTVPDESKKSRLVRIPHPWFDMFGRPIERTWHDCCALVLHAITINPGLSVFQLITQLQKEGALTRMDVCHLIRCAHQEKLIEFMSAYDPTQIGEKVYWMATNDEEVALVNRDCLL